MLFIDIHTYLLLLVSLIIFGTYVDHTDADIMRDCWMLRMYDLDPADNSVSSYIFLDDWFNLG